ncbi:MAG: class I SAM-dependent methyltransferase [Proteobacteria bacterium]|nr:class I SAM-dependent methyltransferase [Pseudomonadota bacterium]
MLECPICGNNECSTQFANIAYKDKGLYNMIRCKGCGVLFADPFPSEKILNQIYQELVHDSGYQDRHMERAVKWNIKNRFIPHLKLIEEYIKPGSLLDLGCGEGRFLKVAQERAWVPYGIELSEPMARKAREVYGLENIKTGNLDFLDYPDESFDVVTFIHCLEHLTKPIRALEEAFRVIRKKGFVYIAVPTFNYRAYRNMFFIPSNLRTKIFRILSQISPPTHIWIFSVPPLKILLNKVGFSLVKKIDGYGATAYFLNKRMWLLKTCFAPFMRLHGGGFYVHILAQKP